VGVRIRATRMKSVQSVKIVARYPARVNAIESATHTSGSSSTMNISALGMLTDSSIHQLHLMASLRDARHFHAGFNVICGNSRYLRAKVIEHKKSDG